MKSKREKKPDARHAGTGPVRHGGADEPPRPGPRQDADQAPGAPQRHARSNPGGTLLARQLAAKAATACRAIDEAEAAPSLGTLAAAAGLSRFHFHRVFKQHVGLTPKAYAMAQRARRMREALQRAGTVTEAIYQAGFNSSSRFYERSAATLGMGPKNFLAGGAGEIIRFAVGACSLGSVLVAASARGVCAILLGDTPAPLIQELRERFPRARVLRGGTRFARGVTRVVRFVEAPRIGLDLPLDVRGTAFQQRVWKELAAIPAGATASYGEIARRIGSPKAVRAVAGACAANTIAVAIPCHRVVHQDGTVAGYRWGVERKKALLQRETPG